MPEVLPGLQQGGVIIERLQTRDGSKDIPVPDGLIHHWVGTVFVPNVGVKEAVALMQDYDRHSKYFAPAIARSKLLEHDGNRFRVALRFHVKKIITVTMDTENEAEFFHPAADRAHSRIRSTRVSEIADAGTPQEKAKATGDENGFMWNLNTYWRFLERDGGTYIQCESLTLTRDVPFALAWIIRPIVTQMPKGVADVHAGENARCPGEDLDGGSEVTGDRRPRLPHVLPFCRPASKRHGVHHS